MCYYTSVKTTAKELREAFNAPFVDEEQFTPAYQLNGFAHPKMPVLVKDELRLLQWGLIPNWKNRTLVQMMKLAKSTLNARDNTIFELPSFKNSITKYRCIIPVTGFFEPHTHNGVKYPFYVAPKGKPFLNLAGIYSHWKNPETEDWISSFSIVTTDANRPMRKIHNEKDRMPVIMDDATAKTWMEEDLPNDVITALMQPCIEDNLMAYSVSSDFFKPKINSNAPYIVEPVKYEELAYDEELYNGFNVA